MPKLIPKRLNVDSDRSHATLYKPEILAPAGDWECARAAVENGADAIFFGLDRFNARMRGKNFTEADLPDLMAYLHERGVRGYVTFNTLVFSNELEDAESFLRSIISAGVDAAIVQDVGICRLIRKLSPDFPIHASTQMSVTSEAGVHFAEELGSSVVVLARECSLNEINAIKEKTLENGLDMPLEIFVHGALCVAYSGQCLTSESLGGRSANRGECAQACRLPYDLFSDGEQVELGAQRYLLSPQDLAGLDAMDGIIDAGVASLKIEGRLKAPEYVAAVTSVYRKALDAAWNKRYPEQATKLAPFSADEGRYALEMTFSRGLTTGWLGGIDNQKLVHARFGKKRGLRLGVVERIERDGVWLALDHPVKAGDGVVLDRGRPDEREEGGRITSVDTENNRSFIRFLRDSVNWHRVSAGDTVYKTSDPALDKALRQSFEVEQPNYKRPIRATVSGKIGSPLVLSLQDEEGRVVQTQSDKNLEAAQNKSADTATLTKQISRLGSTSFRLESLDNQLADGCMVPASMLNQMRRDAVDQLIALRAQPLRWELTERDLRTEMGDLRTEESLLISNSNSSAPPPSGLSSPPSLIPYVRNWEQFDVALTLPYSEIYIELEDPRKYAEAVERAREAEQQDGRKRDIWVAPPRMFKSGEDFITKQLLKCGADGFLARNHEHLNALSAHRMRGDFSLNVANHLTAEYLIDRWKLERLTASYDLNTTQLDALLSNSKPGWFEITLHQHMPMFHMEHCVFCAFLSEGKDFRDCGRPCDTHQVQLKDRVGALHPLKADAGCRNTLFNSKAQTGAEFAHDMAKHGAAAFRIEFLNETGDEVRRTMEHYEALLRGEMSPDTLWQELRLINQLGVTRGTLER
ncbi:MULTISPECIES: U32 family peptidase [unclassified Lentimonas]|uniref:peptidase U32 family protein n=1 Tax=unclassified Lentimonas TaxID=2630993 RepID=UPI00132B11D7|nr:MULTISPECIES: U32 family peptidase [unclassified Lentimonas]CAA6691422.1 peptidase U32 [Lentimonas sp. CC10]CAA6693161.1 peptidase U32 [Lentimonas sp. CC19]CAA7068957.1 peptidase U32 [Lentimonas sp. CC11]